MKPSDDPELFGDYQYLQTVYMTLVNASAAEVYPELPGPEADLRKAKDLALLEYRMQNVQAGITIEKQKWIEGIEKRLADGV